MLQLAEEDQHKLLMNEITNLKRLVSQKEEKLRKLKMAEIYSKKVLSCKNRQLLFMSMIQFLWTKSQVMF